MTDAPTTAPLPFSTAAALWFQEHKRYIKPNTAKAYNDALKPLCKFLGDKPLNEIEIVHVRMYQDLRRARAGAHAINREVGVLQQILREFDEWKRLESRYRQLKETPHRAGHSLSYEDEQRLRAVAFTKKKWCLAGHCMLIMMSTTMGFGELRQLRRRDVDMERVCVTVREGAKNSYRQRTIPLNAVALESMTWILERWKKLGGSDDEHYILPHRPRGERASHWSKTIPWILDQPTTSINSAFRSIRNAAGLPNFRIYDCRVQAITKLLSNPDVSPQVSREIAGHISQAMQSRYSIQQLNTKKAALDSLEAPAPVPTGNRPHDPTRQMSDNGLQKRWNELRKAAGLPWITPHVLRYQCITKMAEGGVDKITAMRVAGHVTDKMWSKYSQVRIDSTREKMTEAFRSSLQPSPRPRVILFPGTAQC